MARRIPLIGELPGPARLGLYYLAAFIPIGGLFYAGLVFENVPLFVAGVFGLSFWVISLVFVAVRMVLKAVQDQREPRQ